MSVEAATTALLDEHVRRFNAAVRTGDYSPLVELFADDAELAFEGVPAGPFHGRDEIAAAYATQPPDDELDVVDVTEEPDGVLLERFAWRGGGTGVMRLTVRDGRIGRLVVSFD